MTLFILLFVEALRLAQRMQQNSQTMHTLVEISVRCLEIPYLKFLNMQNFIQSILLGKILFIFKIAGLFMKPAILFCNTLLEIHTTLLLRYKGDKYEL